VLLAKEITARFHGRGGRRGRAGLHQPQQGRRARRDPRAAAAGEGAPLGIGILLKQAGLAPSSGEGNRLIDGAACGWTAVVSDKGLKLGAGTYVLQVGKRKFARDPGLSFCPSVEDQRAPAACSILTISG
jgi:tyrosyl-tRNA synthetase